MTALEERLSEHLHDRANDELASPPPITVVRRIAKRRSLRTRAAVGAAGLVAIVGMASFIPTSNEPSALITADDSSPDESAQQDPSQEEPAQQLSTRGTREVAGPPPSWRVIADGSGGFAAIGAKASTGRASFVRSDNGVDWYHAGSWEPEDDLVVSELRQVDGSFVAILDVDRSAGALANGLRQPGIAVSQDLIEWTTIDLGLTPAHETSRFAVIDIAIHDADVMTALSEYRDPVAGVTSSEDQRDICAVSTTVIAVTITSCSGERTVSELDGPPLFLAPATRLLQSSDGAPAVEVPVPLLTGVTTGFEVFASTTGTRFSDLGGDQVDPLLSEAFDAAGLDLDTVELLSVTNDQQGQLMVLFREEMRLATLHLPSGVVSELPAELQSEQDVAGRVVSGPGGWAMDLSSSQAFLAGAERDGWIVYGIPGLGVVTLTDEDRSEAHSFLSPRIAPAPDVQWSLFGATRYHRPGTEQVLVELTAEDTLRSYDAQHSHRTQVPGSSSFTGSLEVDGWTLSGDPVRGPLILTSPDGGQRTFDDGFAFTNGDTTDGVEMELYTGTASPFHLLAPHGPIQFFDATGAIDVEFETTAIHQAIVLPALGMPDGSGATDVGVQTVEPQMVSILHSPDGAAWRLVDEIAASSPMEATLVMGDDQILVTRRNVPGVVSVDLGPDG